MTVLIRQSGYYEAFTKNKRWRLIRECSSELSFEKIAMTETRKGWPKLFWQQEETKDTPRPTR